MGGEARLDESLSPRITVIGMSPVKVQDAGRGLKTRGPRRHCPGPCVVPPKLKASAQCTGSVICKDPASEAMNFVDAHLPAFADHGFCTRAAQDLEFDQSVVAGATDALLCDREPREPREFRANAPGARWIRTANDSYFVAMTYPDGAVADVAAERHS